MIYKCLILAILLYFTTVEAQRRKCVRPDGRRNLYLYHPKSRRWYVSNGRNGPSDSDPCDPNQYWDERCDGSVVGSCECFRNFRCGYAGKYFGKSSDGKCYPFYTQANCRKGSWLTPDSSSGSEATCTVNPCLGQNLPYDGLKIRQANYYLGKIQGINDTVSVLPEWYVYVDINSLYRIGYREKCYMTLSQGHCPFESQTAIFLRGQTIPRCVEIVGSYGKIKRMERKCGMFSYLGYSERPVCPVNYFRHGSDCLKTTAVEYAED